MNSRERVQAALRGDTPDALPVMLHNFWPASHELGLTQREYRDNPRLLAAANKAHTLGLPYLIHICGDTTAILEDIVDAGVDDVEVDSRTDVDVAIRATAGKATFVGNIDPAGVLLAGTPEQVRDTTTLLVDRLSGNPRFVLNAGCAIAKLTLEANLRALMEAARET